MTGFERHIRSIYFLGIGGIGMSALARHLKKHGMRISGYDKTPSRLTEELREEGMDIHYDDDPGQIPGDIDMVIYTPAVPKNLSEFINIREMGIPVYKRAEVLGMITRDKFTVAIAGTHGKTTVTSMVAHILKQAGKPVTALLGGISKNYGTNYISSDKEEIMVIEADEYDRSFLQLRPDIAVITSMDADHLDIYQSREGMLESFAQFALQVNPGGNVIIKAGLEKELPVLPHATLYSLETWADYTVKDLFIAEGMHQFTALGQGTVYPDIRLAVPGRHNVENALAAAVVCTLCDVRPAEIVAGLCSYAGVRRRFDIRLNLPGHTFIDDYAHHPRELSAFIQAVMELHPGKKTTGIFQPHLYSRTRDFADGFAGALDLLDEVMLLDIYPAREEPIEGVSSSMISKKMRSKKVHLVSKETLPGLLDRLKPELLLTIGAGDIDLLIEPIEKLIRGWE